MAQVFKTKESAEKAAQSVNHYLAEQQMFPSPYGDFVFQR